MARSRNIKPGFFKNENLVELIPEYRLLFTGLWCMADKEGRLERRPKKIKMELFPVDEIDIDDGLNQLEEKGFIFTYRARFVNDNGTTREHDVIQVINWHKHQKPHHMEAESQIPPPPGTENKYKAKPIYKKLREEIFARDGHQCVVCSSKKDLHINHIIPVSKGGTSENSNLHTLCQKCNLSKGKKDFEEWLIERERFVNDSSETPQHSLIPDSLIPDSLRKEAPEAQDSESEKIPEEKPDPKDLIWSAGVTLLTNQGQTESNARKFLGMLVKKHGEAKTAGGLAKIGIAKPADAKSYLVKILDAESGRDSELEELARSAV